MKKQNENLLEDLKKHGFPTLESAVWAQNLDAIKRFIQANVRHFEPMKKLKQILSHRITKISFFVFLCLFGWFQYISSKQVGYQITFYNSIEYGYYGLFGNKTIRLEGNPDVETFDMLKNQDFAKDKSNVWFKEYLLKEADLASFQTTNLFFKNGHSFFSKDKNHVWCGESLLKDADPNSFIQLAIGSSYSKDKNHVYYEKTLLKDANPATFEIFEEDYFYAKDNKNVYFFGEIIKNADVETFQNSETSSFSTDKNNVYYFGKLLKEADVNTFELLEEYSNLAKDKKHVFKNDYVINADAATFKINDKGEWHDKNGLIKQ